MRAAERRHMAQAAPLPWLPRRRSPQGHWADSGAHFLLLYCSQLLQSSAGDAQNQELILQFISTAYRSSFIQAFAQNKDNPSSKSLYNLNGQDRQSMEKVLN